MPIAAVQVDINRDLPRDLGKSGVHFPKLLLPFS